MGCGSMGAVLAAMCSLQNFNHSSKVMTPVDSSPLNRTSSDGQHPFQPQSCIVPSPLGHIHMPLAKKQLHQSTEKDDLLTRPSLFVSASTNILRRQWYISE